MASTRKDRAREVGRATVAQVRDSVRGKVRHRLADLLRSDPEVLASALELGLVRREWVDDPTGEPISSSSPVEIVQRFLEREVERRPSILSELGLSTITILSSRGDDEDGDAEKAVPMAIVFTDLEGFTAYTEREGDDAAADLLQRHTRTVGPIVRSRGGKIVKRLGDGLLVTFPRPEAAVLAALELVDWSPPPLRMRAGVHWGAAQETRDDILGHDVNVSARVADVAKGGEVLVTAETRDAVEDLGARLEFGRIGRRKVKGLDEPVRVCRVVRVAPPSLEMETLRLTDETRGDGDGAQSAADEEE